MALVESREISLRLNTEVDGRADVSALVAEVEALAREGGEAAPQFAKLSAELQRLASDNGALAEFAALKRETADLGKQMGEAQGRTVALSASLKEAQAATTQASAAQSAAADRLAQARTRHDELRTALANASAELRELRAQSKASGSATEEYAQQIGAARARIVQYKTDAQAAGQMVRQLAGEHRQSAAGVRESEQAERKLSSEYAKSVGEVKKLAAQLGTKNRALDDTRGALKAAGVDTAKLGEEQKRLGTAIAGVVKRIDEERSAVANANPAFKTLGSTADQTGAALNRLGIRSADQIQAEITAINQDLLRLGSSAKLSGADLDRAWAAGQKRIAALKAEMSGTVDGMHRVGNASDQLGTKLKGVAAAVGGIFAVTQLPGLAADLSQTADLYANLGARIELINSSQSGFNVTLEQTADIARATHSGLSGTTNLLAALARAGGELGVSQNEVLSLTETINKANQVAGQSAAASDAAIVQLIQGLQSGVLRGEEFNSIMEQSPRLAKALADGIGVPIGALRAMAEQGKLTSTVVIQALQSQAQAIDTEFAKLPLTVGRAMTDLSTNWTQFLGELDKTTGASATVAKAISGVANNLDTVASAASLVGEVALAALAVKAGGAVRSYTAQLVAATGATTTLGAATAAVAGAASRLAPVLRAMGWIQVAMEVGSITSALIDLRAEYAKQRELSADVAENQDLIRQRLAAVSAQTGVTVTSMQELDAAVATGQIHFDAASASWVAGAAAMAVLRTRGEELAAQFQLLTAEGKSVDEAFSALFAKFSPGSFIGVQELGQALFALQETGTVSAQQVDQAWQQALSKLSAEELLGFGETARLVFQGTAAEAGMLATVLDAQLRAALTGLGIDASAALTGMSAKFIESANNLGVITRQFDTLKERGIGATAIVQQGVEKMLAAADNPTELQGLKVLVEQIGREGKLAGDQVATALDQINAKADELTPGINSVAEAFKELGIVTDQTLNEAAARARTAFDQIRESGTGSARELQQAFQAYAERAVAANNGVASSGLKVEAAQNGLRVSADETGRVIVQSMTEAAAATSQIGEEARSAAGDLDEMGDAAERAAAAAESASASAPLLLASAAGRIWGRWNGRASRPVVTARSSSANTASGCRSRAQSVRGSARKRPAAARRRPVSARSVRRPAEMAIPARPA